MRHDRQRHRFSDALVVRCRFPPRRSSNNNDAMAHRRPAFPHHGMTDHVRRLSAAVPTTTGTRPPAWSMTMRASSWRSSSLSDKNSPLLASVMMPWMPPRSGSPRPAQHLFVDLRAVLGERRHNDGIGSRTSSSRSSGSKRPGRPPPEDERWLRWHKLPMGLQPCLVATGSSTLCGMSGEEHDDAGARRPKGQDPGPCAVQSEPAMLSSSLMHGTFCRMSPAEVLARALEERRAKVTITLDNVEEVDDVRFLDFGDQSNRRVSVALEADPTKGRLRRCRHC